MLYNVYARNLSRDSSMQYSLSIRFYAMNSIHTLSRVSRRIEFKLYKYYTCVFWSKSCHKHIEFVANRKMFACWLSCHYRKDTHTHTQTLTPTKLPVFNRKYVHAKSIFVQLLKLLVQHSTKIMATTYTIWIYAFCRATNVVVVVQRRKILARHNENSQKWSKNTTQSKIQIHIKKRKPGNVEKDSIKDDEICSFLWQLSLRFALFPSISFHVYTNFTHFASLEFVQIVQMMHTHTHTRTNLTTSAFR